MTTNVSSNSSWPSERTFVAVSMLMAIAHAAELPTDIAPTGSVRLQCRKMMPIDSPSTRIQTRSMV